MLTRLYWILSAQFGVDPRLFLRSLRGLPRYFRDFRRFRRVYSGQLDLLPCLHDWYEEGGGASTKSEYFWQDLLVARMISAAKPVRHVDIGSRVDGFVAHVASFREVEVFDLRPITASIPGVAFKQADLMNPLAGLMGYCDSLSCLHALEHFGLGRYGDPLDPNGFETGFANIARLIKPGGTFYLSTPIGVSRVEFNAHRVSDPRDILALAARNALALTRLVVIKPGGVVEDMIGDRVQLDGLASERYALGIFVFRKSPD